MTCYTYSSYQSTQSSICYYLNHQFFQSFCPAIHIIDAVMWIMSISSPLATMLRCQLRIYEESIFNFKTFPNYKLKQSMGFQKIFFWEKLSVQFRSQQKNFYNNTSYPTFFFLFQNIQRGYIRNLSKPPIHYGILCSFVRVSLYITKC